MNDFRGQGVVRGRRSTDRGRTSSRAKNRAEFSMAGPNQDRAITTIVVEQIPEENFEEQQVRDFFSAFGNIEEITMKPYKRLALVKYDNYYSARAAYDSPKVIFDNRFVKVYWFNPQTAEQPTEKKSIPTAKKSEEPAFDKEKFQRDSEVAQKKHEARQALKQETESKRAALGAKQQEIAQKREEEIKRMKEKLAAKGQSLPDDMDIDKLNKSEKASANTEKLLAQLKALEDEAKSLGLDPEPWNSDRGRGRGRGRGRASYRGWNGYSARGGYDPSRGNHRGRGTGSYRGTVLAGGAYNLDNRPKTVQVEGVYFDDSKDESLKQFLFVRLPFAITDIGLLG
jgi:hypothetical protein